MTKQTYGPAGKVKAKDLISLGNGKFKVYKKVKNPNKSLSAKLKIVWRQATTFKYNDPFNTNKRKAPFVD